MQTIYRFDSQGANVTIGVFFVGFLLMFVPLIMSGLFMKLLVAISIVLVLLAMVWYGLARGTYVLIDPKKDIYRTSGFFFSKSVPLSSIESLSARGTLMGLMTNIDLRYRDKNGAIQTMGTMNVQSFKKGDFEKFLSTIQSANPNVEISQALFTK